MMNINKSWTLFLDRDGTINRKMPEGVHVENVNDFEFLPGALQAIAIFSRLFGRVIIVTNQRGVKKNILDEIHGHMLLKIAMSGGVIHRIYYCSGNDGDPMRKPNPGMIFQAKVDFPEISFEKSIVIGDSETDAEMARRANIPYSFRVGERHSILQLALIFEERFQ